ncbi:TAXI family TRAP transporter solute-binding subunit [Actinomadura sp. B10D3]|uniref:TAXI family TRAP transporter solute-binding subunit n=1 Tax=Actinomadura sp. B10D3 TaxID=3153557 RepID=UPI00325E4B34
MRLSRRTLLLAAAATTMAGCGDIAGDSVITLATGEEGGAYYTLGQLFADQLEHRGLHVTVRRTDAGRHNLDMLADPRPEARADLAFVLSDSAQDQLDRGSVAALARMYLNYVHLIVREDSGIERMEDLAGRTVSIGAHGSGTSLTAGRVLEGAGLAAPPRTLEMRLVPSLHALRSKRIDACFWSGDVPTPAVVRFVKSGTPIRLVRLDEEVPALTSGHGAVYEDASIPAGPYGLKEAVPTVGTASYLLCRAALSDDLAFMVTRTLFEARNELDPARLPGRSLDERYAIGTGHVPLHHGAMQYYRSVYD